MRRAVGLCAVAGMMIFSGIIRDEKISPQNSLRSLIREAENSIRRGDFDRSEEILIAMRAVTQRERNFEQEAFCSQKLGLVYWNLGKLSESKIQYESALRIYSGLGRFQAKALFCRTALEIHEFYQQGKTLRSKGELDGSSDSFLKAIDLSHLISSPDHEVKCLRQLSANYWERSQLEEYFEINSKALRIARDLNHRKEEGSILNNLGSYYWKKTELYKALSCFDDALMLSEQANASENISTCLSNLAIIYNAMGDYENALEYLKQVIQIDDGNSENLSIDLNNLGIFYKNIGIKLNDKEKIRKAIETLKEALALNNRMIEPHILNNLGDAFLFLKESDVALSFFLKGYRKARELGNIEDPFSILNSIGFCYLQRHEYLKAKDAFAEVKKNLSTIANQQTHWDCYFGLAQCFEKSGLENQAVDCYLKSIDVIDRVRSQINLDVYKTGFARDKLTIYEKFIGLLLEMRRKRSDESLSNLIFRYIERAKARAFLECLMESRADINSKASSKLREDDERLSDEISAIAVKMSSLPIHDGRRSVLGQEMALAEDAQLRLISKMRQSDPHSAWLSESSIRSLDDVRNSFSGSDTVVIEYFLMEPHSLMFVIDQNGSRLHLLPSRTEILNSVRGYLKFLSGEEISLYQGKAAAKRIFKEILFPLHEYKIGSVKKLIIIPDGILYYLPFESLIPELGRKKDGYLVEEFEISYAPSSSILMFLGMRKDPRPVSWDLLAFGDPDYLISPKAPGILNPENQESSEMASRRGIGPKLLPFSREEIREIAKYFPRSRTRLFLGKAANETSLKSHSGGRIGVLHFACHGYLDEKRPLRSALLLSPEQKSDEDGLLQVRELYALSLSADLVILSACRTARGTMESGEGVMGLPRVFFYTGATNVISTLWAIEDRSTAFFMDRLFQYLSRGNSMASALRQAKIDMIKSPFSHPHRWAAFILNGDPRSRIAFQH